MIFYTIYYIYIGANAEGSVVCSNSVSKSYRFSIEDPFEDYDLGFEFKIKIMISRYYLFVYFYLISCVVLIIFNL